MWMILNFFGGRRSANASDPLSLEVWNKETLEAYVFKADVPGLKKEEVKVEVQDDRFLQISVERNREHGKEGGAWHRIERSKLLERFMLPENAKVDQVKTVMDNGVLTVTVPREVQVHVRSIPISG